MQNQQSQYQQSQIQPQAQQQQGAILLVWEGVQPGQAYTAPTVLQKSTRYMEQLQNNGDIANHRVFVNITDTGGFAVLEGQVDRLIDLIKDPDYRQWLLTCQSAFDRFKVVTALGGSNGEVEAVLAQQQAAYQQTQQQPFASSLSPTGQINPQQTQQTQGSRRFSMHS